jgi:hypothetical protein
VRHAFIDSSESFQQKQDARRRSLQSLSDACENLRHYVCMSFAPGTGIPTLTDTIRVIMHDLEPELLAADEIPDSWESWKSLIICVDQLWAQVKTSCTP